MNTGDYDESQPLDVDDPFDSLTMIPLDLPQDEISKIIELTKNELPNFLPIYHYKSNRLQNVESSKVFVVLKYPNTNKYLLFDSREFFLLQGGRNDALKEETTIASLLARKCYDIFTIFKRKAAVAAGRAVLLPELMPIVPSPEIPTVKDAVLRYAYADRKTNFVHLPACWTKEGGEFEDIYPSFGIWKTFPEDFSKPITMQDFNDTILGKGSSYLLPSEVKAIHAWRCLQMQANHDWNIKIDDIEIPRQQVVLNSMGLDLDYGLVFLVACTVGKLSLPAIIRVVESFLPQTQLMSRTSYVPNGTNWRFATDTRLLPTIHDTKENIYVLVPTPEHTAEVCKMWFFVAGKDEAPDQFLAKLRAAFQDAARSIVDLDTSCTSETQKLSTSVIDSNSTSQATMIRGGVLLSIVSFLYLTQTVPNVQLVMETYNGKQKGMSVNVAIDAFGTPALDHAARSLVQTVINSESILFLISKMCKEGLVQIDAARSSLGFGFRTCHKVKNTDKMAYSVLKFNEKWREILYPMGYLPSSICPNLSFGQIEMEDDSIEFAQSQTEGGAETDFCGIRRVQSYLEYFSMQKASNHHQKHSYRKTASNFASATTSDCMQDSLNLSALKVSLQETLERLDQSFCNFHHIGGSRAEIAIRPVLNRDQSCLVFDIEASVLKCWQIMIEKTIFYKNEDLAQYGAVNSAACVLGYRFALDTLSKSSDRTPEDIQTQQHTFGFMRYLNAVLNTICNGRYVDNNPKLFLSQLGLTVGRPLNLIPVIPFNVSERICNYVQEELPAVETPKFPSPTIRENLIHARIDANISMGEMQSVITVCYSCGKCFYGA